MIHNPELLDRLAALSPITYKGDVYRAGRINLDPLAPSTRSGRWMPEDREPVLYTSATREGALAEIAFHWGQLTPLPSGQVAVHKLRISTDRTLRLVRADLNSLDVDWARHKEIGYEKTQEIGAAIAFLGCDGLIVPSARWECENIILLTNKCGSYETFEVVSTEKVTWQTWARVNGLLGD